MEKFGFYLNHSQLLQCAIYCTSIATVVSSPDAFLAWEDTSLGTKPEQQASAVLIVCACACLSLRTHNLSCDENSQWNSLIQPWIAPPLDSCAGSEHLLYKLRHPIQASKWTHWWLKIIDNNYTCKWNYFTMYECIHEWYKISISLWELYSKRQKLIA